jgi:hypothetical protein
MVNRRSASMNEWYSTWRLSWSFACLAAISLSMAVGGAVAATVVTPVAGPPPLGPLAGNGAFVPTTDLGRLGYALAEFFVDGVADSYHNVGPLTNDKEWVVAADGAPQPFKTRIQVIKPIKPRACKGTVFVEWFNVSAQSDYAPDWFLTYAEQAHQGAVYVGVSAQRIGVATLQGLFPDRYGSLVHPGDSYSYDVFSQVGQALLDHADTLFGHGCAPERLIATGHSQSGGRLVTYVNAFSSNSPYSGFIPRGTGANPSAALRQAPLVPIAVPGPTYITSRGKPVLRWQSQTESMAARQPDAKNFRWWEVAGTAHQDVYPRADDYYDSPEGAMQMFDFMIDPVADLGFGISCTSGVNAGPAAWVLHSAYRHMSRWVKYGTPPPSAPRFKTVDGTATGALVLDEYGNVVEGVRTPHVDAPIATLTGSGNTPAGFCGLFGRTIPFSDETLDALYPTHGVFVSKWAESLFRSVKNGYIVPEDAWRILLSGVFSDIGK